MILRRAGYEDLPSLLPLWIEIMRFHEGHNPFFRLVEDHEKLVPQMIKKRFENDNEVFFVAEIEGQIAGMIFTRVEELPATIPFHKRGYIAETVVGEKFRSQGIGEQLVLFAKDYFRDSGCDVMELQVSVKNPRGISFWKRMGFELGTQHMIAELK